jgi:hypothetical protein
MLEAYVVWVLVEDGMTKDYQFVFFQGCSHPCHVMGIVAFRMYNVVGDHVDNDMLRYFVYC